MLGFFFSPSLWSLGYSRLFFFHRVNVCVQGNAFQSEHGDLYFHSQQNLPSVLLKVPAKRLACDKIEKRKSSTIHSSKKKKRGHKNGGLLLKTMDYIIE